MTKTPRQIKNGFATKADLRILEHRLKKKFSKVDERFEEMGLEIRGLQYTLDEQKKWMQTDLMRYFTHEWQKKIDPILMEIEHHRQKEVLWAEQNRRTEEKVDSLEKNVGVLTVDVSALKTDVSGLKTDVSGLKTDVSGLKTNLVGLTEKVNTLTGTVLRIAKKVGA